MGDEWDEVLDRGLASYSAAEPLAGLEERVLGRVRGASVRRVGSWFWGWVAAACLVLVCLGWVRLRPGRPTVAPVQVQAVRGTALQERLPEVRAVARRVRRRNAPVKPRLSPEEVLLVRLATADPEGAVREFASLQESVNRDLTVEPLVVEPIKIEGLQGEREDR